MAKNHPYDKYLNEVLEAHRLSKHNKQIDKLNRKFDEITRALQKHYRGDMFAPFKSGSLRKKTAINTRFDLDMIVPFKSQRFDSPKKMFKDLNKTLNYLGFTPRAQNVSIGVPVKINKSKVLIIDVVPGLEINDNNYISSGGDLRLHVNIKHQQMGLSVKTNIERQIKYLNEVPDARNIIRLLKVWKLCNKVKFKSFVLELITARAFKGPQIEKGLWNQLRMVLIYIGKYLEEIKLTDPGNKNNHILVPMKQNRKKHLADILKKMVRELDAEAETGEMKAIKRYFPKKNYQPVTL